MSDDEAEARGYFGTGEAPKRMTKINEYRGLRCNVCRKVIGYTVQKPIAMLAETGALCPECYHSNGPEPT